MNESIKINSFELENVKRVKAVSYEPTSNGLTVIGGRNGQGKTSILDGIAWALGGTKLKPSEPMREGSYNPPRLEIKLSNGLIVSRTGSNSTLKVVDPSGKKSGQRILDDLIGQLALDLPKFMEMSDKEKANELLNLLGLEDELTKLEGKYQEIYAKRHSVGQIATQKDKYAKELVAYDDAPLELVSASELIQKQQAILLQNAENQKKRHKVEDIKNQITIVNNLVDETQKKLEELQAKQAQLAEDFDIATTTANDLEDESTAELEAQIKSVDEINQKVRANQERARALQEAADYKEEYDALTEEINELRDSKTKLLESVDMPLDGLSIQDGALIYNGRQWDCMSGAEQLKVATAIVRALNPKCGFVLMDKLEQMDVDTMHEFGEWLEGEGLQVIATRVTNNTDEASIIIEDGYIKGEEQPVPVNPVNDWGDF
ncbi:AAA family ATPase [Veillonella caviae]|uniref:AAA family ATPase n=1 Tax=Veillonella caviae TaxID=248316 RepID=UPI002A908795|nr:AAA family ATPase [Veillonella caviae]MDD7291495.1 AAA family ATPase [Veillonella caviae]MDY5787511.1 AAA family ATPase [Veillonella caviae]